MKLCEMHFSIFALTICGLTVPAQAQSLSCLVATQTTDEIVQMNVSSFNLLDTAQLDNENNWTLTTLNNKYQAIDITASPGIGTFGTIVITPDRPINFSDSELRVSFHSPNINLETVCSKGKFMPGSWLPSLTNDSKNADISITGSLQAGVNAKPLYSYTFDGKYTLAPPSAVRYGFAAAFKAIASQQTNADPDSMKLSGTFRYITPLVGRNGLIIDSDIIGYEFSRTVKGSQQTGPNQIIDKNSNRMHSAYVTIVRSQPKWGSFDFRVAGIEFGKAVSRTVKSDSQGETESKVLRGVFGISYFNYWRPPAGLKRIDLEFQHTQRVLQFAEPYKRINVNGGAQYLSRRARPVTTAKLTLTVIDGIGVTAAYLRGSLPPTYQFVDHQLTIGLTVLLKRR